MIQVNYFLSRSIQVVLENGADNHILDLLEGTDQTESTVLHYACWQENYQVN